MKTKNLNKYLFGIELILLFLLTMCFVPACDDLTFRYDDFFQFHNISEFFHSVLYYGNGRLLGNALIILFSKIPQVFYVLIFAMTVALCCLAEKLFKIKNLKNIALASLIFMPLPVLRETLVWMTGYINYIIPSICLIATISIMCTRTYNNKYKTFALMCIFLAVIGFCEQLFIEHNTLINLAVSLMLSVYFYKNREKEDFLNKFKASVVLLTSNIAGAAVMFGYKLYVNYDETFVSKMNYRQTIFSVDGIRGKLMFAFENGSYLIFTVATSIFAVGLLLYIMLQIAKKENVKNIKLPLALSLFYVPLCTVCCFFFMNDKSSKLAYLLIFVFALISAAGIIMLFIKTVIKYADRKTLAAFIGLILLAVASFAPFLAVSPCSFRCCFLTYFFVTAADFVLLKFLINKYDVDTDNLSSSVSVLTCIMLVVYSGFYFREKKIYMIKEKYAAAEYYLPSSDENLVHLGDSRWELLPGGLPEHEYIPLKEWETLVDNN